jgi:hypothetical protein
MKVRRRESVGGTRIDRSDTSARCSIRCWITRGTSQSVPGPQGTTIVVTGALGFTENYTSRVLLQRDFCGW